MQPRKCPSCGEKGVLLKHLFLNSAFYKKIVCTHCGSRLRIRIKFINSAVLSIVMEIMLWGSIFLALAYRSWLVLIFCFIAVLSMSISVGMYGSLETIIKGHSGERSTTKGYG